MKNDKKLTEYGVQKLLLVSVLVTTCLLMYSGNVIAAGCANNVWKDGESYKAGSVVFYKGRNYQVLQSHVALKGGNLIPPAYSVLWKDLGTCVSATPPTTQPTPKAGEAAGSSLTTNTPSGGSGGGLSGGAGGGLGGLTSSFSSGTASATSQSEQQAQAAAQQLMQQLQQTPLSQPVQTQTPKQTTQPSQDTSTAQPQADTTPSVQPSGPPTAAELMAKLKTCSVISNGRFRRELNTDQQIVPICKMSGAVYWISDMAIDCDGIAHPNECGADHATQSQTAFTTSKGKFFDAIATPYFVIPEPSSIFDYRQYNIQPGAVAVIIYKDKLVYAVFADLGGANTKVNGIPTNELIGEASVATAKALGIPSSPVNGGTSEQVTYIVFQGSGAVPSPVEDHDAATKLGEQLARQFINNN